MLVGVEGASEGAAAALGSLIIEACRVGGSPGFTVLTEGAADVGGSNTDVVLPGARLSGFRYERYVGPAFCLMDDDSASSLFSLSSAVKGPDLVHRSMRSNVVSSGKFSRSARPYRARLSSAYDDCILVIEEHWFRVSLTASDPRFRR